MKRKCTRCGLESSIVRINSGLCRYCLSKKKCEKCGAWCMGKVCNKCYLRKDKRMVCPYCGNMKHVLLRSCEACK